MILHILKLVKSKKINNIHYIDICDVVYGQAFTLNTIAHKAMPFQTMPILVSETVDNNASSDKGCSRQSSR